MPRGPRGDRRRHFHRLVFEPCFSTLLHEVLRSCACREVHGETADDTLIVWFSNCVFKPSCRRCFVAALPRGAIYPPLSLIHEWPMCISILLCEVPRRWTAFRRDIFDGKETCSDSYVQTSTGPCRGLWLGSNARLLRHSSILSSRACHVCFVCEPS